MTGAPSTPARRSRKRGGGRSSSGEMTTLRRSTRRSPASGGRDDDVGTEYEKQRLSRIRENRERLESLGLRSLASAALESSGSGKAAEEEKADAKKRRRRGGDEDAEDDEYQPSGEDEGGGGSSSGEETTEEEECHASPSDSRQPRRGKKKNSSNAVKVVKISPVQPKMDGLNDMDDDAALQQAVAISLEEPMKCSGTKANMVSQFSIRDSTDADHHGKSNLNSTQGTPGGWKRRKSIIKRPQMTEDELVAYFFSFDEVGKGSITARDLMRMAAAHDFHWSDKEIADMIYLFDNNKNGQLSLDDFRIIASRCNMMREPANG